VPDALSSLIATWASIYAGSAVLRTVIGFAHVGGLVVSGGAALVADRAVLRAVRGGHALRERQAAEMVRTHRVVISGLAFVILSGVLLGAADLDTYIASKVFWIKMGAILLLSVNGALMIAAGRRIEAGHDGSWSALRATAVVSLFLWTVTTLLGAALPNVS
jgi:hypothetical protein